MTKQISPLRQRMIDDMAFRNMSPNTQKVYTYAVANFARFHRQSPDQLGVEHVREYRLHLMARGLKATWKDYRENGTDCRKVMNLSVGEFMRRFLLHVLPDGFHRIRHYGLFANGHRAEKLSLCRKLLDVALHEAASADTGGADALEDETPPCPCCGGRMKIIETFERGMSPRTSMALPVGIDSS